MIKTKLVQRIAEQNPHLFAKDVKRASTQFWTRSKQPWLDAIELRYVASEHLPSRLGRLGLLGEILRLAPLSASLKNTILPLGQEKR